MMMFNMENVANDWEDSERWEASFHQNGGYLFSMEILGLMPASVSCAKSAGRIWMSKCRSSEVVTTMCCSLSALVIAARRTRMTMATVLGTKMRTKNGTTMGTPTEEM